MFIYGQGAAKAATNKVFEETFVPFDIFNSLSMVTLIEQNRHLIPAGSRALLDIDDEVLNASLTMSVPGMAHYGMFVLAATCGVDLVPDGVVLVGNAYATDSFWPHAFLETLPQVDDIAEALGAPFIVNGAGLDRKALAESGYAGTVLTPQAWLDDLGRRVKADVKALAAMLTLLGVGYDKGTFSAERGMDAFSLELSDAEAVLGGKKVRRGTGLGALDIGGAYSVNALYWACWFALTAQSGNALKGRLAGLTALYADPGYGELREGSQGLRYDDEVGILGLRRDLKLGVLGFKVVNGGNADVLATVSALDAGGVVYLPKKQGDGVISGLGAEAMGVSFEGDLVYTQVPLNGKATKITDRPYLDKATVDVVCTIED